MLFRSKLRSNAPDIYNNRGTAHVQLGNLEPAFRDFNAAIERDREFSEAYYNRGTVNVMLESIGQALKDFDTAIELNPKYARAYYKRSLLHGKLGNRKQEKDDYDKAMKFDAENRTSQGRGGDLEDVRRRLNRLTRENERLRAELAVATDAKRDRLAKENEALRRELASAGTARPESLKGREGMGEQRPAVPAGSIGREEPLRTEILRSEMPVAVGARQTGAAAEVLKAGDPAANEWFRKG